MYIIKLIFSISTSEFKLNIEILGRLLSKKYKLLVNLFFTFIPLYHIFIFELLNMSIIIIIDYRIDHYSIILKYIGTIKLQL